MILFRKCFKKVCPDFQESAHLFTFNASPIEVFFVVFVPLLAAVVVVVEVDQVVPAVEDRLTAEVVETVTDATLRIVILANIKAAMGIRGKG